jgi:hypothetical protein
VAVIVTRSITPIYVSRAVVLDEEKPTYTDAVIRDAEYRIKHPNATTYGW